MPGRTSHPASALLDTATAKVPVPGNRLPQTCTEDASAHGSSGLTALRRGSPFERPGPGYAARVRSGTDDGRGAGRCGRLRSARRPGPGADRGELMPSRLGEQPAYSRLDLSRRDTGCVQIGLEDFPVPRSPLRHLLVPYRRPCSRGRAAQDALNTSPRCHSRNSRPGRSIRRAGSSMTWPARA